MDASEHAQLALAWLAVSDEEFAEGKRMQASEKLWGATAHALTAVAMERGWKYGRHRDFVITAQRLVEEAEDDEMAECFYEARQFHANFYKNFLRDEDIAYSRPRVHEFALKVLTFLE
ncbi:MAG: hypothetical protein OXH22_00860 [Chloroflexi bacterium]|nr:hypothetical protein [Chloroflexota bacterium]